MTLPKFPFDKRIPMLSATVSDQEVRAQLAIKDRLIDYWADVDRNGALCALEYYTQDCVYIMCDHRMEGHADIKRYYDYRASRGDRLVRHVASNLRVRVHAPDRASLEGILCVYARDGLPIQPSSPPILVADIACEFVRGQDEQWRFRMHQLIPLFAGGVEVLVPPGPGHQSTSPADAE